MLERETLVVQSSFFCSSFCDPHQHKNLRGLVTCPYRYARCDANSTDRARQINILDIQRALGRFSGLFPFHKEPWCGWWTWTQISSNERKPIVAWVRRSRFAYIPFAVGPRACIGREFTEYEIAASLRLHRFLVKELVLTFIPSIVVMCSEDSNTEKQRTVTHKTLEDRDSH